MQQEPQRDRHPTGMMTASNLGMVTCANQDVNFDGYPALASLLQLTDLPTQDLESFIHMKAMQIQQNHTCSKLGHMYLLSEVMKSYFSKAQLQYQGHYIPFLLETAEAAVRTLRCWKIVSEATACAAFILSLCSRPLAPSSFANALLPIR